MDWDNIITGGVIILITWRAVSFFEGIEYRLKQTILNIGIALGVSNEEIQEILNKEKD